MVKHNNAVPNAHFRKHWKNYVRTWHNQPARAQRRCMKRQEKAAKGDGKPIDWLRPIVRCPSQKYNWKVRAGRGFTLEELKAVGIHPRAARTIGITVDKRRKNRSEEGLEANVLRLKEYMTRLVVLPRGTKAKKGHGGIPNDTLRSDIQDKKLAYRIKDVMPIVNVRQALVNPPA